jgi:hypothetical protein
LAAQYRLQTYSGSTLLYQATPAALNVQVRARVAFGADVVTGVFDRTSYPSGGAKCSGGGCHNTPPPLAGQVGLISFSDSAQTIYCHLVGCPTAQIPQTDGARKFVDLTDATNSNTPSSVLLRHPTELDGLVHAGLQRCAGGFQGSPMTPVTPSTCDLTPILEWIEDGANDF